MRNMPQPICFMIRNRAQKSDMIDQVLKARRAFIGYPAHKFSYNIGENNLKAGLYDLSKMEDWTASRKIIVKNHGKNYAKQVARNLNLVRDAVPGSIILVPRPDRGLVYAGTLEKFELLDDPSSTVWGEEYIQYRFSTGLNKPVDNMAPHIQDLAQSFLIKETNWVEIPFVSFPVWMQRTFFGRSTTARLRGIGRSTKQESLKLAYNEARRLMEQTSKKQIKNLIPDWSNEPDVVKQRLQDRVGAETFEHLVVALLQLENSTEQWMQCGGSGDGGVDGIGTTEGGDVSLLQCKWEFWGKTFKFGESLHGAKNSRRYFAYLNGVELRNLNAGDGIEVWGPDKITSLVIKHALGLPMAKALRIKS